MQWLYLLKIFERPELYKKFNGPAFKFENVHTKFKVSQQYNNPLHAFANNQGYDFSGKMLIFMDLKVKMVSEIRVKPCLVIASFFLLCE